MEQNSCPRMGKHQLTLSDAWNVLVGTYMPLLEIDSLGSRLRGLTADS